MTFRLGTVSGDLVSFDLTSGGTGEPDRDWLGEAPALFVPPLLWQNSKILTECTIRVYKNQPNFWISKLL